MLALETQLEQSQRRMEQLERRSQEMRAEMEAELENVRRALNTDIVPLRYKTDIVRAADVRRIPIERDESV